MNDIKIEKFHEMTDSEKYAAVISEGKLQTELRDNSTHYFMYSLSGFFVEVIKDALQDNILSIKLVN